MSCLWAALTVKQNMLPFFAVVAQITRSKTSRASITDLSGGKAADGSARES